MNTRSREPLLSSFLLCVLRFRENRLKIKRLVSAPDRATQTSETQKPALSRDQKDKSAATPTGNTPGTRFITIARTAFMVLAAPISLDIHPVGSTFPAKLVAAFRAFGHIVINYLTLEVLGSWE